MNYSSVLVITIITDNWTTWTHTYTHTRAHTTTHWTNHPYTWNNLRCLHITDAHFRLKWPLCHLTLFEAVSVKEAHFITSRSYFEYALQCNLDMAYEAKYIDWPINDCCVCRYCYCNCYYARENDSIWCCEQLLLGMHLKTKLNSQLDICFVCVLFVHFSFRFFVVLFIW